MKIETLGLSFTRSAPGDEVIRQVEATPTLVPNKWHPVHVVFDPQRARDSDTCS
jgi:hypothetical protein